jgi:hypothetical protein
MLLLAASIVFPILILLGSFVKDVNGQIAVASGERRGLASLRVLGTVFEDASAYRAQGCVQSAGVSPITIGRDIAAMDRMEAGRRLGGADWIGARQAWSGASTRRGDDAFIDGIVALFPIVSDRSGLTYDPDVGGIDRSRTGFR